MRRPLRRGPSQILTLIAAAALIPVGAPAIANAEDPAEMSIDSYVLPLGTEIPALHELQVGKGSGDLENRARMAAEDGPLAPETVGPAATYAQQTTQRSGTSAELDQSPSLRATYPEPSRTMSLDECRKGLGKNKKFFIKSRFAVCSGASFVQTWKKRGRPVGQSMFNVRVVGTIAKNSRTIKYQYHFSEMNTTGRTGVGGMLIKTTPKTPKSWPSRTRYTQGGNVPGAKSYNELKRLKTFHHTVNAKAGQGTSGTTDLIFAVYEPTVLITPPPGWTLTGTLKGKLPMLAPRWDAAKYLANSTGGGNAAKKGSATFSYITTLRYSAKTGAEERAVAQHIKTAFENPGKTKPTMAAKKVPGQVAKDPLHRLVGSRRSDDNRKAAVKQCKRYWGANYSHGGTRECDEYPFATTYEGAAEAAYDSDAKKFNFSVKPLAKRDNGAAGNLLLGFYAKNRLVDGMDDGFLVKITS